MSAPLSVSRSKSFMIQLGGCLIMAYVSMLGIVHSTLGVVLLTKMGAIQYFSTFTVFQTIGVTLMNPVGGKLGDMFGRRRVMIVAGSIAIVCATGLAFVQSFVPYMILRILASFAQGAFQSSPYVIVNEVCEKKDVPRAMSLLAVSITVSIFLGAQIAGFLNDAGMTTVGLLLPVPILLIGLLLVVLNYPDHKSSRQIKMDWAGIFLFSAALLCLLLGLNFGARIGWTNPLILGAFVGTIVFGFVFMKVEDKVEMPYIAPRILKNKGFLLVAFTCALAMYYNPIQNNYGSYAVLNVMGGTTTQAGSLTLLKTIVAIFLPAMIGTYAGKHSKTPGLRWKFMAITFVLLIVSFLPLTRISATTPVTLLIVCAGLTGVADAFRSCVATPTAQSMLDPADIGVGTGLILAMNATATPISSGVAGIILDSVKDDPTRAVNSINMYVVVVSAIGLVLVLTAMRKVLTQRELETASKE